MAITFYTNPMSRGQIARWALHEAGADYEQELVAYGEEMQGDYRRDINPMAKVPAIVHDGKVVTECAAICAYLAEAFPAAALAPRADERAAYFRWMFFAAGPVEAAVTNNALGMKPEKPEQSRTLGYGDYDRTIDTLEAHFERHAYVCGERFTAADVYVGSQVVWGTQFGTMPQRDSLIAYAERLTAREAYREAKAIDTELIEQSQQAE
ncbi:glutathione S-transferase family protein [Sphingomicrobium sp. XHP0235]|uniref:glutathione S-transferase family protein n=1 Tax=Sphingomicrobium aquimarinum TaxID=3133971 RepID=UPI0031FF32EB